MRPQAYKTPEIRNENDRIIREEEIDALFE